MVTIDVEGRAECEARQVRFLSGAEGQFHEREYHVATRFHIGATLNAPAVGGLPRARRKRR